MSVVLRLPTVFFFGSPQNDCANANRHTLVLLPHSRILHQSHLAEYPSPLPALKSTCVLVKIYAVSLQYRDLLIALLDNLVPCCDMAGEVVAIGADVNQ